MSLAERVAAIEWYHSIELAPGLVTPGWLDHRRVLDQIPLPASLHGQRCMDVGTFNGFWAFELERRGADQVVAIDVLDPHQWDWPAFSDPATVRALAARMADGDGFEIARTALGSAVQRLDRSIYDLSPDDLGRFDVVYLGSLLVHLRDPVGALQRVREICAGTLILMDGIDLPLTLRAPRLPLARLDGRGRPWWWYPNLAALVRMVEDAGFELVGSPRRLFVPTGPGWSTSRRNWRGLRSRDGRYELIAAWLGDPHAAIVARPRP